jgi:hypothetical protein
MDSGSDTYFGNVADSYDRLQPILSPPYSKGLDMLVELIPSAQMTGSTLWTLAAELRSPPFEYYSISAMLLAPAWTVNLRCLRSRHRKSYRARIELRQSDMASFQIPTCDVAFSAKTLSTNILRRTWSM